MKSEEYRRITFVDYGMPAKCEICEGSVNKNAKCKIMKILKIKQRTEEWYKAKELKLSASRASAIGNNGAGLKSLCFELVADHYSNSSERFISEAMQIGIDREEDARMVFEIETGLSVEEVGMVVLNKYTACSPDGLTDDNGGLELKCPTDKVHFQFMLEEKIKSEYIWQCQMSMLVTGRNHWWFASYCPNFDKSLVIVKVEKDLAMQEKLIVGIEKGKKLIRELEAKFKKLK